MTFRCGLACLLALAATPAFAQDTSRKTKDDPAQIGKLAGVDVGLAANAELGLTDLYDALGAVTSDARAAHRPDRYRRGDSWRSIPRAAFQWEESEASQIGTLPERWLVRRGRDGYGKARRDGLQLQVDGRRRALILTSLFHLPKGDRGPQPSLLTPRGCG